MNENTFGKYKFPNWVSVKVAQQIMDFWGCFGRTYKDWLENSPDNLPNMGDEVVFFRRKCGTDLYERLEGKFIHTWNNMGRIILSDGTDKMVSSCDEWISKTALLKLPVMTEGEILKILWSFQQEGLCNKDGTKLPFNKAPQAMQKQFKRYAKTLASKLPMPMMGRNTCPRCNVQLSQDHGTMLWYCGKCGTYYTEDFVEGRNSLLGIPAKDECPCIKCKMNIRARKNWACKACYGVKEPTSSPGKDEGKKP